MQKIRQEQVNQYVADIPVLRSKANICPDRLQNVHDPLRIMMFRTGTFSGKGTLTFPVELVSGLMQYERDATLR